MKKPANTGNHAYMSFLVLLTIKREEFVMLFPMTLAKERDVGVITVPFLDATYSIHPQHKF